jgi:hypothetical protein
MLLIGSSKVTTLLTREKLAKWQRAIDNEDQWRYAEIGVNHLRRGICLEPELISGWLLRKWLARVCRQYRACLIVAMTFTYQQWISNLFCCSVYSYLYTVLRWRLTECCPAMTAHGSLEPVNKKIIIVILNLLSSSSASSEPTIKKLMTVAPTKGSKGGGTWPSG